LSRSAFMARFSEIFGRSPMVVLRDLRMRQAAIDMTTTTMTVDVIARNAGYESRSSFVRSFRHTYGHHPSLSSHMQGSQNCEKISCRPGADIRSEEALHQKALSTPRFPGL